MPDLARILAILSAGGLVFMTIFSCRVKGPVYANRPNPCQEILNTLSDSIYCQPNNDSTYYLCQERSVLKSHNLNPDRINSLSIVRCRDGEVILKEDIRGGSAIWMDFENVKIFYPSGIPKETYETTYYFNVNSRKKSKPGLKNR